MSEPSESQQTNMPNRSVKVLMFPYFIAAAPSDLFGVYHLCILLFLTVFFIHSFHCCVCSFYHEYLSSRQWSGVFISAYIWWNEKRASGQKSESCREKKARKCTKIVLVSEIVNGIGLISLKAINLFGRALFAFESELIVNPYQIYRIYNIVSEKKAAISTQWAFKVGKWKWQSEWK